jgi:hypothetical protein
MLVRCLASRVVIILAVVTPCEWVVIKVNAHPRHLLVLCVRSSTRALNITLFQALAML